MDRSIQFYDISKIKHKQVGIISPFMMQWMISILPKQSKKVIFTNGKFYSEYTLTKDDETYTAVKENNNYLVRFLLENGANVDYNNCEKIKFVIHSGVISMAKLLLQFGCKLQFDGYEIGFFVRDLCDKNDIKMLKLLSTSMRSQIMHDALIHACYYNKPEIVKIFINDDIPNIDTYKLNAKINSANQVLALLNSKQ